MAKLPKILPLVFCLIFLFFCKMSLAGDPIRKLSRGLANSSFGWVEIFAEVFREAQRQAEIGGLAFAPLKGIVKAIGRTLVGVYEATTFFIPLPSGYRPLIEPEFIF